MEDQNGAKETNTVSPVFQLLEDLMNKYELLQNASFELGKLTGSKSAAEVLFDTAADLWKSGEDKFGELLRGQARYFDDIASTERMKYDQKLRPEIDRLRQEIDEIIIKLRAWDKK